MHRDTQGLAHTLFRDAIYNRRKTITKEMLYTYAMPVNALKMLIEEIEQGEDLFEENEQDRIDLLYKIGLRARDKERNVKKMQLKKWRRKA